MQREAQAKVAAVEKAGDDAAAAIEQQHKLQVAELESSQQQHVSGLIAMHTDEVQRMRDELHRLEARR